MVRRGLAPTRERAQALLGDGQVIVKGSLATKSARLVSADEPIELIGPAPKFVSRGGYKLEAALDAFSIEVASRRCLDAGASTGGFTDCLLQRGASSVVAVDVGYGQLHERLRSDERVKLFERTNIRNITVEYIGGPCSLVVADLSFISLRLVLDALMGCLDDRVSSELVVLVKPQFEAGRKEVSRAKGVVRDPIVWREVLDDLGNTIHAAGAAIMGVMVSPITGAEGNVEFLALLAKDSNSSLSLPSQGELFDRVIDDAQNRHGN